MENFQLDTDILIIGAGGIVNYAPMHAYQKANFDVIVLYEIDRKKALTSLPPLIKGYLRVGGFIGDGAVVDEQFNTTDVCVIVKTDLVTDKYFKHYSRTAAGDGNAPSKVN